MAEPGGQLLSVIIPTRQRRAALARALTALAYQSAAPDTYEVVVAVDGSTDGTHELLARSSPPFALQVTDGPGRGRGAACNAALARARGEVVIVLDDDMCVVPDFIASHRRHHPPGSAACVLGAAPVLVEPHSPLAARHIQAKFAAHFANLAAPGHVYTPRDFYSGNASMRTEVLRAVGGFDESFRAYGNEDVELWIRLRAAGVHFRFDPEARAYQEYDKSLRGLAADTRAKGATTVLLARTHPEVFPTLRLAAPLDGSRPWLAARALLLALTTRRPQTASAVFAVGAGLERLGLWRAPLFYRALLDYAFWAGAAEALDRPAGGPEPVALSDLRTTLHRASIDLLLHR